MIRAQPSSPTVSENGSTALSNSVLILNRSWMPVHIVSVRRAIVMLYRSLGEIIHTEDGQFYNYNFESWLELSQFLATEEAPVEPTQGSGCEFIRTVNFLFRVPRVLKLHSYDKVPRQTLRFNRRNLFARDNHQCQFCQKQLPHSQLSFDHVIPRSRGGQTNWENVVCSCLRCNSRKGNRTPDEAGMHLARKPVKPKQNPVLSLKLDNPRYECWRAFVPGG